MNWIRLIPVLFLAHFGRAQDFHIKSLELTKENIIIYYDLVDTTKSRVYTINVYSSHDKYTAPLQKVNGDVGLEVRPGENKVITWNAKQELGETYRGELNLEIKGRVYIPFIQFNHFEDGRVMKRGKAETLTWTGGTRQNILNFAIYKGDKYMGIIPNVANTGSHDIVLPKNIAPGKGYHFIV